MYKKIILSVIRKYPYWVLFVLSFSFCFSKAQNNIPVIEKFEFEEDSLYSLKGALFLPNESKFNKIVIFLTSVWYDPNLDFAVFNPALKKTIQFMTDNKTGVLLLSRDSCLLVPEKPRLMHIKTAASDTEKALKYLRTTKKYRKIPIGIMGGSETGCAASIVASRNKDIAFAILISTPGVTGTDEHEYDRTRLYSNMWLSIYFSEIFADSIYFFEKEKFIYKQEPKFARILYDNYYKGIIDVERQIIPEYDNYDSIAVHANELFYKKWDGTALKPLIVELNKTEHRVEEYVQMLIQMLFSPRYIEFSKWNPRQYLSAIKCPTLMLYGEKDLNINLKDGLDSVQQIIKDYNLSNFTLKFYEGLNHFLLPYKEEKEGEVPKPSLSDSIPDYVRVDMSNWLNKIHK